jgi:hypothetical protein
MLQSAAFGAFGPLLSFSFFLADRLRAILLIYLKENLLDNFQ